MKKLCLISAVVSILVFVTTLKAPATAQGAEIPICTESGMQYYPAIWENKIVWQDYRNGDPWKIYMYDLTCGIETLISEPGVTLAISGDKIVWVKSSNGERNISMYDLGTGGETICTESGDVWNPAISGDKIVWEDWPNYDSARDIYMYDLATETETPICTADKDQGSPAIWGDKIVWQDYRNGNWDIYMYDLWTDTETSICTDTANQGSPAIWGDKIVWHDDRNGNCDIYMYDLSTKTEIPICAESEDQMYPAIWVDKIVWQDHRNGNWDIYMYTLSENEQPVADAGPDQSPVCTSLRKTLVTLDGSGSDDPDADQLIYTWTGPFPEGDGTVMGVNPTVTLQIGISLITLVVNDGEVDSEPDTVVITITCTPQQHIELIIDEVETLVNDGVLNQGRGNSLIKKLEDAIHQINKGKEKQAINNLEDFISAVNAFIKQRVLLPSEGQLLIDEANDIITQLI